MNWEEHKRWWTVLATQLLVITTAGSLAYLSVQCEGEPGGYRRGKETETR